MRHSNSHSRFSLSRSSWWGGLVCFILMLTSAPAYALPDVLSEKDQARYEYLFLTQEQGNWKKADAILSAIENDILISYALKQRYLHPTAYISTYTELYNWLKLYGGTQEAGRIYRLALKKRGTSAAEPPPHALPDSNATAYAFAIPMAKGHHIKFHKNGRKLIDNVNRLLARDRPTVSLGLLHERKNTIGPLAHDYILTRIAASYFFVDKTTKSLEIASEVANRNGEKIVEAYWYAGLASWRRSEIEQATEFFTKLARAENASAGLRTAGAYWAGRGYMRLNQGAAALAMFASAATAPETFYGILASHQLGFDTQINWYDQNFNRAPPPQAPNCLSETDIAELFTHTAVRRAKAFMELGMTAQSLRALVAAETALPPQSAYQLSQLALLMGLPPESIPYVLKNDAPPVTGVTTADFPLPDYQPQNGFTIDRALIYAIVKQESKFNPAARNRSSGASGLMQLLPRTAAWVMKDPALKKSDHHKLFDPAFNLYVGQIYLRELMSYKEPGHNLIKLMVAYNAGLKNLKRWWRENDHQNDPLLFMEGIPVKETRHYTKQTLRNLWVYRFRLNEPTPSLSALAQGEWALYQSVDIAASAAIPEP